MSRQAETKTLAAVRTPRLVVPALYRCRVRHERTEGVRNVFEYGVFMWLVDLDDLPELPRWLRPLARFDARDHLGDPQRSVRANVDAFLATRGIDVEGGRVVTLTQARCLGHVFNPLTVHWCYDGADRLACVVAEVHNTYGERHCYLVRPDRERHGEADKEFYVSPFFPVDGHYTMRFPEPAEHVEVAIELRRPNGNGEEATVFTATMKGERRPATATELLRCVARYPLGGWRVPALIRYQGVKLFLRRIPIVPRPRHTPQEDVQ